MARLASGRGVGCSMIPPMLALLKYWRIAAAGAALAGAAYGGWWVRDAQATKALAVALTQAAAAQADQRMAERAQREAEDAMRLTARELEDLANAQPAGSCLLPLDRVLRLDRR